MTRAGSCSRIHLYAAALSLFVLACGAANNGGDGDGDGDGDGTSCESAVNCDGIQVCDPTDNTCQTDVPCTDHAACGKGGNCNTASGVCEVSTTGSPCETDTQCREGEACVGAGNATGGFCGCDGEEFTPMPVTPNMLVLLDRSGSMTTNDVPGTDDGNGGQLTRMEVAKEALTQLVTDFDAQVRFGLWMYPNDNGGCNTSSSADVDVGMNQGSNVVNEIPNAGSGNTPLRDAIEDVVNYPGLMDPTRPNYIISVQDGAPNCPRSGEDDADVRAAILASTQALMSSNVRTFVIGFGDGLGTTEQAFLNEMARTGGTARMMGGDDYYAAESAQDLDTALQTIGGQVLACSFQLEADDDAIVRVFFDGSEVPDGWTFDPVNGTITFDDQTVCDQLQEGNVDELVIVNSCPLGTD